MGYNRHNQDVCRKKFDVERQTDEYHEGVRRKKLKYSHYLPKDDSHDYPVRDDDVDFLCRNIRT